MRRDQKKKRHSSAATSYLPLFGQSMRFTAFGIEALDFDEEKWRTLTDIEPLDVRIRPQTVVSGRTETATLTASSVQNRLDFVFQPTSEAGEQGYSPMATIGDLGTVFGMLRPIIKKYFGQKPKLQRIALGCTLIGRTESERQSNEKLCEFLHDLNLKDGGDVSDLMFQINRRRDAECAKAPKGLRLNRLSRWTSIKLHHAAISAGAVLVADTSGPVESAIRVDLDINTVPEFTRVLPQVSLLPLLDEFYDLAEELAKKGDPA